MSKSDTPTPVGEADKPKPVGAAGKPVLVRSVGGALSAGHNGAIAASHPGTMAASHNGTMVRAIGLMSGTSMDGIDVAMIETDGNDRVDRGPALTLPYNPETRRLITTAIAAASACRSRTDRPEAMATVERVVTDLHAAAIKAFLAQHAITPSTVAVIGFHGQTVLHKPDAGLTIQLGDGAALAALVHIPIVYDLRASDVAAGGQGAPLVPVYHQALAMGLPQRPIAIVNIGGVANVTYVGRDGQLLAFDTGPGNALIDDWMMKRDGTSFDSDGALAARGTVHDGVLHLLLSHSYFSKPPPKSLDRNAFVWDAVEWMTAADGAATLTAFTAEAIASARQHFPEQPELWIVCGGGRKNRTLMSMLAGRVENAVVPSEAVGLDGDAMEAEAWAYLAVRALNGLPISFPGTTGVSVPMTGGVLVRPPG
jgi:anhydro-N-acetylmuramic acid kinase